MPNLTETEPLSVCSQAVRHYDRPRAYTFGALIIGLLLFWIDRMIERAAGGSALTWSRVLQAAPWLYVSIYVALIFIRARWFNILVVTGAFIWFGWSIGLQTLAQ